MQLLRAWRTVSPPGPARGSRAASFELCASLMPAHQHCCCRAVCRKGCSGSALRLDLHRVHPQEGCGSDPSFLCRLWFLAGIRPGKYSPGSFSSGHFARENGVAGKPDAGLQMALWFCCWVMQSSLCTCPCLSFSICFSIAAGKPL